MKVVGLITEYNPFHNGHLYHLKESKKITGADYIIVVMSGNFVQRGGPALIDKYSRTKMALACGADIVFELPVCFSTASAELFSLGAVSLLDGLGIVDSICFGSEDGDVDTLSFLADVIINHAPILDNIINQALAQGSTYPAARMKALKSLIPGIKDSTLTSPNNILGIEYLKALKRLSSQIMPVTLTRKTAAYHEETLRQEKEAISSATAIRKSLEAGNSPEDLKPHVPEPAYAILMESYRKTFPVFSDDLSLLLNYKLMLETKSSLVNYTDITTDLANRMMDISLCGSTFSTLAQDIKSRQWTLTRINRGFIHLLLNLYSNNLNLYKTMGYCQYGRILGFKKTSSHLLKEIRNNGRMPLITKMGDAHKLLPRTGITMLDEDVFAARLYNQVVFDKFGTTLKDEYTHGVIIN